MRRAVIAAVLSLGVIAAGAAPANGAATRAEYIADADPICLGANTAMKQAAKGLQQDKKTGRFKVASRKIRAQMAIFGPAIEQIAALEAPASDVQLIGTWVQMLRSEVPVAHRLANDYAHAHILTKAYFRLGRLITESEALVASYGFTSCNRM